MKQYTAQEAAMALGVDIQTLYSWLSRNEYQAPVDSHNPQQYVLDQVQVEQLAREHNLALTVPQASNDWRMHAGGSPNRSPVMAQNSVPVAAPVPVGHVFAAHKFFSRREPILIQIALKQCR